MKKLYILIIFIFLISVSIGCSNNEELYSGTIEGDEVPITAEIGGTIKSITVDEGSKVKAGETIATIDDQDLKAKLKEVEEAVAIAKVALDEAKAGTRNQEVQQTLALLEQTNYEIADANIQTEKANNLLDVKNAAVEQAKASYESAKKTNEYQQDRLIKTKQLFQSGAISEDELNKQKELTNQAEAQMLSLKEQLNGVVAQYEAATKDNESIQKKINILEAKKKLQLAQLDLQKEGATEYSISKLYHRWQQSLAQQEQIKLQLKKTTITAPMDGIIIRKNVSIGEVAKPNGRLFTLLNSKKLKLKVFVPENKLGQLTVGNPVEIMVDSYPDKRFKGMITFISEQAEFTPRNVQTPDERAKLVFAVTIVPKEGFAHLKPGMPADVRFLPEERK